MNLIWGIILVSVTLKCWIGQIIIAFSPKVAAKIKIIEPESDVNQTFFADMHGEAIWDALILIISNNLWTYFGLVGGGMYLYFVGRTITSHLIMQRHGIHIGRSKKLKVKYIILTLWGIVAVITIIMAATTLTL